MEIDGLIVGLGNPTDEYIGTRHNIGADILNAFVNNNGLSFHSEKFGSVAFLGNEGKVFVMLIPSSFMNNSGETVKQAVKYFNLADYSKLLVVHDEYTIPFGEMKISYAKSSAGHNGVQSIINHLGTQNFYRLRVGIGADHKVSDMAKFVLSKFSTHERNQLTNLTENAHKAILEFTQKGAQSATNKFN